MIFSVYGNVIEWFPEFGPDSVNLTVDDLVKELTLSSQELPLEGWSLFLSQRQNSLNNHLARVPFTPNREKTLKMRHEVLSSFAAQNTDTSGYLVSDLDVFEIHWENNQLDKDAVFRPSFDTPFSRTALSPSNRPGNGRISRNNGLGLSKRRTRKNTLLHQQHQSRSDQHVPLCWWDVDFLEQELRTFPIMSTQICLNNL